MKKIPFILGLIACLFTLGLSAQNATSQNMSNSEIVKTFLNGFNHPEELPQSITLLSDSYHFTDPTVTRQSKADFLISAQELGKVLTGVEIIHIAGQGDWVAVMYNFKSSVKGLENNYGSEWFSIQNGKIMESHLVYDATEWRKVFAQMAEEAQ